MPGSAPLSDCPHRTRRPAATRSALQYHTTFPTCLVVERRNAIRRSSSTQRTLEQKSRFHTVQTAWDRSLYGPTDSRGHSSMGAGISAGKAALQTSYKKLQERAKGTVLAIAPAAPEPNARHMQTYPAGWIDL